MTNAPQSETLSLTAKIVSAYVSNNKLNSEDLPELINSVHASLQKMTEQGIKSDAPQPAHSIEDSIQPDYLICLEDGRQLKMLKRYLRTRYGLSPEEYRAKWGLPADYPMVAPNYAQKRSKYAKEFGLGRKSNTPKTE